LGLFIAAGGFFFGLFQRHSQAKATAAAALLLLVCYSEHLLFSLLGVNDFMPAGAGKLSLILELF